METAVSPGEPSNSGDRARFNVYPVRVVDKHGRVSLLPRPWAPLVLSAFGILPLSRSFPPSATQASR